MVTPDKNGYIPTAAHSNHIIKTPFESQDQVLYSTKLALSTISTLLSATLCLVKNSETLQLLHLLGRQDSEDLDHLIIATNTRLLQLTCLLFNSKCFWNSLLDSWTNYLMSPFKNYLLNNAQ